MTHKKIRAVGAAVLVAVWALLTGFSWFGTDQAISEAERRQLAQVPTLSADTLLDGSYMEDFEDYTLDQFPLRDTFRQIKSIFHFYGLRQADNNQIYIQDGYAAKQLYPLDQHSVDHAVSRFTGIYNNLLAPAGAKVYVAVVPDKSYYLGQAAGQLTMDYEALFATVQEGMPYATYIDLTGTLSAGDYYRTDTHWRQEKLIPAATAICNAMGVTAPSASDYTVTALERPFYGVYYGQAALPMDPETMYLMESDLLDACSVTYHDYGLSGKVGHVYDEEKLTATDLYEVYLGGSRSILTIENPNAATDRELIIFRDSFGSSIAPLLVQDYARVTLIDIRYITSAQAKNYVNFENADVLFLYSTLVLNESSALRP